jgi:hypothetical protein
MSSLLSYGAEYLNCCFGRKALPSSERGSFAAESRVSSLAANRIKALSLMGKCLNENTRLS